ncbi:hypothetical protein [Chitinimonas naiadis]
MWPPTFSAYFYALRRLANARPWLLGLVGLSLVVLSVSTVANLQQRRNLHNLRNEAGALRAAPKANSAVQAESAKHGVIKLPAFKSAAFVDGLGKLADAAKLPMNEITFSLDDNADQPYLRYRATMTVEASYPAIRRFVEKVQADMDNVSLDTLNCTRADIDVAEVSCDLGLSAFYARGERG